MKISSLLVFLLESCCIDSNTLVSTFLSSTFVACRAFFFSSRIFSYSSSVISYNKPTYAFKTSNFSHLILTCSSTLVYTLSSGSFSSCSAAGESFFASVVSSSPPSFSATGLFSTSAVGSSVGLIFRQIYEFIFQSIGTRQSTYKLQLI